MSPRRDGAVTTISQSLAELFRGKGAHADPIACVEDISSDLAQRRVHGFPHSIADLVFHMNYWMSYELRCIRGERPNYPKHNAESLPPPGATGDWDRLKRDLVWLLSEFATLAQSSREELDRQIETIHDGDKEVAGTLEAVLWQMVAHNSYHTGQIAMLCRSLNAWPPTTGGDTS